MFENAGQFDRALKKAAKAASGDAGNRYRQALRDRFLCRVFSDPGARFVLKGGSGLLARIPDARATRDIDFATSRKETVESAMDALTALASKDMGDFMAFELDKAEESLDQNGYSRLLKLRFKTFVGHEEKDPILIDLSLDCATTQPPERIVPANRLEIEGIETSDYLAYPLPDQLADKLCAIMELQSNGYPSSRMKDLVDVVFYVTHEAFSAGQLSYAVECECDRRNMAVPEAFAAPETWVGRYETFAKKNGSLDRFASFDSASALAASFFDPVLNGKANADDAWDYEEHCWKAKGESNE